MIELTAEELDAASGVLATRSPMYFGQKTVVYYLKDNGEVAYDHNIHPPTMLDQMSYAVVFEVWAVQGGALVWVPISREVNK